MGSIKLTVIIIFETIGGDFCLHLSLSQVYKIFISVLSNPFYQLGKVAWFLSIVRFHASQYMYTLYTLINLVVDKIANNLSESYCSSDDVNMY